MPRKEAMMWAYVAIGVVAWVLLVGATSRAAAQSSSYTFDPALSISEAGDADLEDPVPDPGAIHPEPRFEQPCGVATDGLGFIYISSPELLNGSRVATRIDVFNPQGEFLGIRIEADHDAACDLAVDSEGNLYSGGIEGEQVDVFRPSSYPPSVSTGYSLIQTFDDATELGCPFHAVAINHGNDHLVLGGDCQIREYGSAAEGFPPIRKFPVPESDIKGGTFLLSGMDVYGLNHDVYSTVLMRGPGNEFLPSRVYVFDGSSGSIRCEVEGAEVSGDLAFGLGAAVAVDQSSGAFFVYDTHEGFVYRFAAPSEGSCEFIGKLPIPPVLKTSEPFGDIAVDAPLQGEATYESPNDGYVFVTSGRTQKTSHLFAFKPKIAGPPEIKTQVATGVTEEEAVLRAQLNPGSLKTSYHFEYTTQAAFDDHGYTGATLVPIPDADAGAGGAFGPVAVSVDGLDFDTPYRFRVVANNCAAEGSEEGNCLTIGEGVPGGEGADAVFRTYPAPSVQTCPNADLRLGPSKSLADCRAYELVTPADTGGHVPRISILGLGFGEVGFDTLPVSADGASAVYGSNSGAILPLGGGGFLDTYRAVRRQRGWESEFIGVSGAQAERPKPGGIAPDHDYSFWNIEEGINQGTLVDPIKNYAQYLRVPARIEPSPNCAVESEPAGGFEWIGCGSLGHDPEAGGKWITKDGTHVIFNTGYEGTGGSDPIQLEEECAPSGVNAIYDRTPGGNTQCVSIPPSNASPAVEAEFETSSALYKGVSNDGTTVIFELAGVLYARLNNLNTAVVAEHATFAGISADGDRVFYLTETSGVQVPEGAIYVCDIDAGSCGGPDATQTPIPVGSSTESIMVNVSADGSHAYFLSKEELDGEEGEEGENNLYVWDGLTVTFIGVVEALDVDGPSAQGLGRWVDDALAPRARATDGPANATSRTSPDGSVLVFESRADLIDSGYDNAGHSQVFRYDTEAGPGSRLLCVSCNPTGKAAESDARLQIPEEGQLLSMNPSPVNAITHVANVSADGQMVFFQSGDRLVPGDLDGKLDVYEWEAQGTGGCTRSEGCLSLISYGQSSDDEYLYGMTPDGHDVLFLSGETLVGQDLNGTPSIYDARVEGGFPAPAPLPGPCLGEACQPTVMPVEDSTPSSATFAGPGNVKTGGTAGHRCPKGKRKVVTRGKGKTRCVKRGSKKRGKHSRRDRGGVRGFVR